MEVPHRDYNLCKSQPKLPEHSPVLEPPSSHGCKTLNSLRAGLKDEKAKRAAQCECNRLNPKAPKPSGCHTPDDQKKTQRQAATTASWNTKASP